MGFTNPVTSVSLAAGSTVGVTSLGSVDLTATSVTIAGAQVGAVAVGGFTVPNASVTVNAGTGATASRTIAGVAGKAHTFRTLVLGSSGNSGGLNDLLTARIQITNIATSTVLYDYTLSANAPGVNASGAATFSVDLLGLAGSVGSAVQVQTTQAGGVGACSAIATVLYKTV